MNPSSELIPKASSNDRPGCLSELGWFAAGAVLPLGSLSFYRKVSKRRVGMAILFFFVFTILITILTTIKMGSSMIGVSQDIRDQYTKGVIPKITIRNGIAEVDGPQPAILVNQRTSSGVIFIAVDTTGQITSIDTSRYTEGILLTRTDLHFLSNTGNYQVIPLSEVNKFFGHDPLLINADTVASVWKMFAVLFSLIIFILLVLWNSVVRLMFIAMFALILWGVASLIRPKIGFAPFIISGLYAIVPAVYLAYLFGRINASFLGLQTLLLVIFWALALVGCLAQEKFFSQEIPARLWMALIGLPMLIWFIVDYFVTIPFPYGELVLFAVALLTGLFLVGLRVYYHIHDLQKLAPAAPGATA